MKIAVYTIALNEEKHVKRWFESAKDADLLVIADTGSTDKTRYLAKSLGISVTEIEVKPWRFDVARNASLALIPEDFDICIQLDMDEVLPEGWRNKVEEAFVQGNTWPIYKHVTTRDSEGKPRNFQHYFKIHPRMGFYWKYPIHEVLVHLPELNFDRRLIDLEVDHIKDPSKSRKSYLDLLEKAIEDEPTDWRMNHYLNREYFYNRDWLKVVQSAYKCDGILGGWDVERASTYMWASEASHHLKMPPMAEEWAKKATDAAPNFYEVWHWRAHIAHLNGKWSECLEFASKRLTLERQSHHLVKPEVWEWWGYDLMALSSHRLGLNGDAVKYGEKSLSFSPNDERLISNLGYYKKALEDQKIPNLQYITNHIKDTQKKISLAFVFDDNYLYPFLTAIYSAALHADTSFDVIVADTGINLRDESKKMITSTCEKLNINLSFFRIPLSSSFNRGWGHITPVAIGKLFLMDLLPSPFLYCDVDIIFMNEWQKILEETNFPIGVSVKAVEDAMPEEIKQEWCALGSNKAINSDMPYFNTGVMIVDPNSWRESDYPAKWKDIYFNQYDTLGFRFFDQDILNFLIQGSIIRLPEQYNYQVNGGKSRQKSKIFNLRLSKSDFPLILHFYGSAKPWNYSKKSRETFFAGHFLSPEKYKEKSSNSNYFCMNQYFWLETLFWRWAQTQDLEYFEGLNQIYSKVIKSDT